MSVLLLINDEDDTIDSHRPQVDYTAPVVRQANDPGENSQHLTAVDGTRLPDPTVGGQFGSGIRNGFSTGFRAIRNRQAPFSGAVAAFPIISNPVQGRVGINDHAGSLYAGVRDQLTQYNPTLTSQVASFVGNIGGTAPAPSAPSPQGW